LISGTTPVSTGVFCVAFATQKTNLKWQISNHKQIPNSKSQTRFKSQIPEEQISNGKSQIPNPK
jgi:hypothetical protein